MSKFTNALDNIRVASPCSQDWDEMSGDERARFCGECKLNVYNLSGMSRREAENLIFQSEGNRLCVRFFRRADGTILTKDCPVGWQAIKRNISKTATAFASLVFAAFGAIGLTRFFAEPNQAMTGSISTVENLIPIAETFQDTNKNTAVVTNQVELEATTGMLTNINRTGWNVGGARPFVGEAKLSPQYDEPIRIKRRR